MYVYFVQGDRGLVDVANKLVSAVALPEGFSYTRDIQSPAVQQYYAILQALALNQAEPEWSAEQDDTMVPDSEMLARCEVTGGVFQTFKVLAGINDDVQHAPKVKHTFKKCIIYARYNNLYGVHYIWILHAVTETRCSRRGES